MENNDAIFPPGPGFVARSREALRRALLDAATRIIAGQGVEALSMRRVAAEVGCSTMVLYTMFGGKRGLLEALWREGFARLWEEEGGAPAGDDPLMRLWHLGQAYRRNALANPHYYRVMFGTFEGFTPSAEAVAAARKTFAVIVDAVRVGMAGGVLRAGDPELVAQVLWATAHGVVSLELAGQFGEPGTADRVFEAALRGVAAGFMSPGSAKGA